MVLLQKWFQPQCAAIFQRISAAASNQITPPQFCDPKQKMGFCVNWWLPWSCMPNMALSHMCCMWNAQYEYLWYFSPVLLKDLTMLFDHDLTSVVLGFAFFIPSFTFQILFELLFPFSIWTFIFLFLFGLQF